MMTKRQLYDSKQIVFLLQKALKALNDRMKLKDLPSEAWPELEESQSPLLPPTHQLEPSSIIIDMNNSNKILTPTKEDLNQHQISA
ncbi:unnamed protein product [Rotaria sordida]|uniref:Uncharacterized protein n=1 Tax=Rotaria sordida TaxID=392033 RepID=A0A819BW87_9BILA|nr:unnamed protein product [Rotaria sordida]